MNARRKLARTTARRETAEARANGLRLCRQVAGMAGARLVSWGIHPAQDLLVVRVERDGVVFESQGSYRRIAADPGGAATDIRRQMDEQSRKRAERAERARLAAAETAEHDRLVRALDEASTKIRTKTQRRPTSPDEVVAWLHGEPLTLAEAAARFGG